MGKRFFVSVYRIERCYGGPQEGGWWYDWTSLSYRRAFKSLGKARRFYQSVLASGEGHGNDADTYNREGQPLRRTRFSMIGGADRYTRLETSPKRFWTLTTERPYYC